MTQLLVLPALVALACNAILGNETGEYVEPDAQTGSSSSSTSGSSSGSSGDRPDATTSSSGGSTSSGSSSSGGVEDAGPCRCAHGCLDPQYPTLCAPEDLPILATPTVTALAVSHAALYVVRSNGVERHPFPIADGAGHVSIPTTQIAAIEPTIDAGSDVLFWIDPDTGLVRAAEQGDGPELDAGWPTGYAASDLAPGPVAAYSFARKDGGPAAFLASHDDGRPAESPRYVSSAIEHPRLAANTDGLYWASPLVSGLSTELNFLANNGTPTHFDLWRDAGLVTALTASERGAFVAGGCEPAGICRIDGIATDAGATTVLAVPDKRIVALYAASRLLLWTEEDGSTLSTHVCDVTDCAASRHLLGGGELVAAVRDATSVYYALEGAVYRIERVP